jgi:hypothetical protein
MEDRLLQVPVTMLPSGDMIVDKDGKTKKVYGVSVYLERQFQVRLNLEGVVQWVTTDTIVQFNLTKSYENYLDVYTRAT